MGGPGPWISGGGPQAGNHEGPGIWVLVAGPVLGQSESQPGAWDNWQQPGAMVGL